MKKLLTFVFLVLLLVVAQIIAHPESLEITYQVPTDLLVQTSTVQVSNETFGSTQIISHARDVQQCSCPNCGCNGQPCPKAANGWVVLSSLESCSNTNNVPSTSLVNIQSTSSTIGFKYYLVDEDNKNKALAGQGFSFNTLKSYDTDFLRCMSSPLEGVRYPAKVPGKVFLIARTSGSTTLQFNIQMACVRPKFVKFSIGAFPINSAMKHIPYFFYGQEIGYEIRLLDQFDDLDTIQKGKISYEGGSFGDSQVYHDIVGGSTILKYTPTANSVVPSSVRFTAVTGVDQDVPNIPLPSIGLREFIIDRGTITLPQSIASNTPFTISFSLFQGSYEVTPGIDVSKLTFIISSGTVLCEKPTLAIGSSTIQCTIQVTRKSNSDSMSLRYDNKDIASADLFNLRSSSDRNSIASLVLIVFLCLIQILFLNKFKAFLEK